MAVDQPTPPEFGNRTTAEFLALPLQQVVAQNAIDPATGLPFDDTFQKLATCVVALLMRAIQGDRAELNELFACRKNSPLTDKICDLVSTHWKATDNGTQPLTLAKLALSNVVVPQLLFSLDATAEDEVSNGAVKIQDDFDPPDINSIIYALVNSPGRKGPFKIDSQDINAPVYGIRMHKKRWYYTDSTPASILTSDCAASLTVTIPEWSQDNANDLVFLTSQHIRNVLGSKETGSLNRLNFEFGVGLGNSLAIDPRSSERDYVLYLRWRTSDDTEVRVIATTSVLHDPISVTPGREYTLGFIRRNGLDPLDTEVIFFINGIQVSIEEIGGSMFPAAGNSSDIRLIVGSSGQGDEYVGGPVNNVIYYSDIGVTSMGDSENRRANMNAIYQIGAGYAHPTT